MKKPILVVMAAGMGSRYGGLKQMDPVGANGEVILDYSVFDARRAGFETVVFIIKREIEAAFKARIGSRIEPHMEVRYAYQDLHDLPEGYAVPEGRVKPWGTGQAIIAGRDVIDAPFAVINADDYYGVECFRRLYDFLTQPRGAGEMCIRDSPSPAASPSVSYQHRRDQNAVDETCYRRRALPVGPAGTLFLCVGPRNDPRLHRSSGWSQCHLCGPGHDGRLPGVRYSGPVRTAL